MSTPDNAHDERDERPVKPHHFWRDVIVVQDKQIAEIQAAGKQIPADLMRRIRRAQEVLMHGNGSGRSNPTINLPDPWGIADIEAIIGQPEDLTPGSDAAWRAIAKHYDATHAGWLGDGMTR